MNRPPIQFQKVVNISIREQTDQPEWTQPGLPNPVGRGAQVWAVISTLKFETAVAD